MLGYATDYFVISKRKGGSEMHFWMEFVKKTLRYYAVTCTFAMCMAHDVRHLRPVHNEATIFSGFARTGSQFTRLIFLAKSQQVLRAHRKSIYAPDFSRQITKSSAFISRDNFNVRFVRRIRIKEILESFLFSMYLGSFTLLL